MFISSENIGKHIDYEFLGFGYSKDQLMRNWREDFDVVSYHEYFIELVSKQIYDLGERDGVFNHLKYRYVILGNIVDCFEDDGTESELYSAFLVPETDQVPDKVILSTAHRLDYGEEHIEKLRKELTVCDLADEDYGVFLGAIWCKPMTYKDEEKWDSAILNGFATAIYEFDLFRDYLLYMLNPIQGVFHDKPYKGDEMTGWDYLEIILTTGDIPNLFQSRIAHYHERI